jgi:hypothetical protein
MARRGLHADERRIANLGRLSFRPDENWFSESNETAGKIFARLTIRDRPGSVSAK